MPRRQFEDYPLLNEPNVMVSVLKLAKRGPVRPGDSIERLVDDLRRIGEDAPDDLGLMRRQVARAFHHLSMAGLLDPDENGRYVLTTRGEAVLSAHPGGVDESVLKAFPEFQAYVRSRRTTWEEDEGISVGKEPKPAYEDGYAAYGEGLPITANPHSVDTVSHLEWENGWSEARDEDMR